MALATSDAHDGLRQVLQEAFPDLLEGGSLFREEEYLALQSGEESTPSDKLTWTTVASPLLFT